MSFLCNVGLGNSVMAVIFCGCFRTEFFGTWNPTGIPRTAKHLRKVRLIFALSWPAGWLHQIDLRADKKIQPQSHRPRGREVDANDVQFLVVVEYSRD